MTQTWDEDKRTRKRQREEEKALRLALTEEWVNERRKQEDPPDLWTWNLPQPDEENDENPETWNAWELYNYLSEDEDPADAIAQSSVEPDGSEAVVADRVFEEAIVADRVYADEMKLLVGAESFKEAKLKRDSERRARNKEQKEVEDKKKRLAKEKRRAARQ